MHIQVAMNIITLGVRSSEVVGVSGVQISESRVTVIILVNVLIS